MKFSTVTMRGLLMASLVVLSACGGGDEVGGIPPATTVGLPPPTGNNDYIMSQIIPMLQNEYGSIRVPNAIGMMNGTMAPNTYTWAQMYQTYILGQVQSAGCGVSNTGGINMAGLMSPMGSINYNCLQGKVMNYMNPWYNSYVQFERSVGVQYRFFEIFNWFLSLNSSYYNEYTQYYGSVNYYNRYPQYAYQPYWGQGQNWNNYNCGYAYGAYTAPYARSNGGWQVSIMAGGTFN